MKHTITPAVHPQNVFGKTVKLLLALYDRMGDRISLQYGGSNAHRKANGGVQADPNLAVARSELGTSIKRHYANAMLDRSKQVWRRKGLPCPAQSNVQCADKHHHCGNHGTCL